MSNFRVRKSQLRKMIREAYKEVLSCDDVEDVKPLEDNWGGGSEQLVAGVDHKKAYGIKEAPRKLKLAELKDMIIGALNEHKKR